jgi:hypothetical protein
MSCSARAILKSRHRPDERTLLQRMMWGHLTDREQCNRRRAANESLCRNASVCRVYLARMIHGRFCCSRRYVTAPMFVARRQMDDLTFGMLVCFGS